MKLHIFKRADLAVKGLSSPLGILLTDTVDGVRVGACLGEVADIFRTSRYGEVVHPPPPETHAPDAEFDEFLRRARLAGDDEFPAVLAGAAA